MRATAVTIAAALAASPAAADHSSGAGYGPGAETLSETALHLVPPPMTYDEYRDANRRLSSALLYFPIPGGVHHYAGESRTGWTLTATGLTGLALIIAGAAAIGDEEGDLQESDFETVDIGENTYERVPVVQEDFSNGTNVSTTYRLRKLGHDREPRVAGVALIGVGALMLVGTYAYDLFHGLWTVERKRDRARYRWGQRLWLAHEAGR